MVRLGSYVMATALIAQVVWASVIAIGNESDLNPRALPAKSCKQLDCSDRHCKGSSKGTCSTGSYKGCKCKTECPNPKKISIDCEIKDCKGKKEKCTAGKYKGCGCITIAEPIFYLGSKKDVRKHEKALDALMKVVEKQGK